MFCCKGGIYGAIAAVDTSGPKRYPPFPVLTASTASRRPSLPPGRNTTIYLRDAFVLCLPVCLCRYLCARISFLAAFQFGPATSNPGLPSPPRPRTPVAPPLTPSHMWRTRRGHRAPGGYCRALPLDAGSGVFPPGPRTQVRFDHPARWTMRSEAT